MIVYNTNTQIQQNQNIEENSNHKHFLEKLNNIKKEYEEFIKIRNSTEAVRNAYSYENLIPMDIYDSYISSISHSLGDYLTESEWNEINKKISLEIKSFYEFHSGLKSFFSGAKDFLRALNPLWQLSGTLSTMLSEINETGVAEIDTAVMIGQTITTVLSALEQDEKDFEYSKQFIIDIFGTIVTFQEKKDLIGILGSLEFAKKALNNIELGITNLLTLPVAKGKINRTLTFVKNKKEIASERYREALRRERWSSSWY
ncbi:hypothetical protein [Mycoplasmopsis adleri]|uniref:hypothetical protein n=1 Tax=Mycoplasmopsis adleri TaxID=51362 RepID=UPI0038731DF2